MDEKQKIKIAREYLAGRYNEDIMKDYGVTKGVLYGILKELNIPRKVIKKPKDKIICKKCGFAIDVKNAKFCPECGTRIITKDTIIEILDKFTNLSTYLPVGIEKEFLENINIIEKYLNE